MAPTMPFSSDIVNGVAGVVMMICIMPVLEQVRLLSINRADRLDSATTGFIPVGEPHATIGENDKEARQSGLGFIGRDCRPVLASR